MIIREYQIIVENIAVYAFIGHLIEERKLGQRIFIDLNCNLDPEKFEFTEELDSVYNYENLCAQISSIVDSKKYHLLESLAKDIAMNILSDKNILSVDLTIRKVSVPINAILDSMTLKMSFKND
jgi:dihydroneopterin aldolase